ncbi:MAG: hypothetical protein ACYC0C_00510 [Devosia sp.]
MLILDESTSHLSVKQTKKVIGFVRGLKARGSGASSSATKLPGESALAK